MKWTSLLLAMGLVAGACTDSADTTTTLPQSEDQFTDPSQQALSMINEALGGTQTVQDVVIFLGVALETEEGQVDVYDDIIEYARSGAGETVVFDSGWTWTPTSSLVGEILDETGALLPTLSLDYGILGLTAEGAAEAKANLLVEWSASGEDMVEVANEARTEFLVQVVTADFASRRVHLSPTDLVVTGLDGVEAIPVGATVASRFIFAQTMPGTLSDEAGLSPNELFRYRWEKRLIQVLGDADRADVIEISTELVDRPEAGRQSSPVLGLTYNPARDQPRVVPVQLTVKPTDPWELNGKMAALDAAITDVGRKQAEALAEMRELLAAFPWDDDTLDAETRAALEAALARAVVPLLAHFGITLPESIEEATSIIYTLAEDAEMDVATYLRDRYFGLSDGVAKWFVPNATNVCKRKMADLRMENEGLSSDEAQQPFDAATCQRLAACKIGPGVECADESEAHVFGDPHMSTLDGLFYSNQAVGEFLLFDNGTATIQIRTERIRDDLSLVSAVGLRIGDTMVNLDESNTGFIRIDGEIALFERGVARPIGSGTAVFTGTGWVFLWPDGTFAEVNKRRGFDILLTTPARSAVGLLGDGDGNPDNDFKTRSGTQLTRDIYDDFERFYPEYVDSWRITDSESLLHYEEGESTATFTLEGFPVKRVTSQDLDPAVREEAEAVCLSAGIELKEFLEACILDVGATDDAEFAYSAYVAQSHTLSGSSEPPGSTLPDFQGDCPAPGDEGTMSARFHIDGVCYNFDSTGTQLGNEGWVCNNRFVESLGEYIDGSYFLDENGNAVASHDTNLIVNMSFQIRAPDWAEKGLQEPFIYLAVTSGRGWWSGATNISPNIRLFDYTFDWDTGVAVGRAYFYDRHRYQPTSEDTLEVVEGTFEIVCPP